MNKKLIFSGSLILGVVLTVIIYFSIGNILKPFKQAPIYLLAGYVFIVLFIHFLHTVRWKLILDTTGHRLSLGKLFGFWIMGYSLNYITPTAHVGGEPLKAAMLKESKVPYHDGVSSIFIDKSLEVVADGFFALTGLSLVILSFALPKTVILNYLLVSVICIITLIWIFFNALKRKNAWHSTFKFLRLDRIRYFKRMESTVKKTGDNIHNFFIMHKGVFRISVALSLVMWGLMFVEYKLLFLILGFDATPLQLFVIISFVGLAYVIPVPAALGVLEAGQLSAFSILSLDAPLGIAASIVIRAKDFLITIAGMIMISIKGLGALKSIKEADENEE